MASNRAQDLYDRLVAEGEPAIDELILARESEAYFLDFKRSSNDGGSRALSTPDRKNLAKAISGFGNSEGGVIVWGVDCSDIAGQGDIARAKLPLQDASAFRARIEGIVSGCTVPGHERVVSHPITSAGAQGYVVTYIPKSARAPHQTVPDLRYFMRAGSAFAPVPHGVLQGMFGRRPQPRVFPNYVLSAPSVAPNSVSVSCGISVCNEGPGMAIDMYTVVTVLSEPGPNCRTSLDLPDQDNWAGGMAFGVRMSLASKDGYKLPPDSFAQPVILNIVFLPPFESDLKIQILVGCDGSVPFRDEWVNSRDDIEACFEAVLNEELTGHAAATSLLAIPARD